MTKKILVLIFFLLIPFKINASFVYAQTPTPEPEEVEEKKSGWEQFWDDFLNIIININSSLNWFIPKKNVQISCEKQTNFTDYNAINQNSNSRAQSNSSQRYRKGTYLKAILDGAYDDDTIAYLCNNVCTNSKTSDEGCIDIKYSTLVYYFYQKGEKILYDKSDSKKTIDYDSTKMESYNYTIPQGTDSYFKNLYNNISQIPQGAYQGEADTAAGSSSELNGSLRTFIPASAQTEKPPSDITNTDNAEKMTKDNEYHQRALYSNFIPAESQKVLGTTTDSLNNGQILGISTDTDTLKKIFSDDLHPASWQNNQVLIEESDEDAKKTSRGMSQYGAVGMALSNLGYEQILKNYYGDIKIVDIKDYVSNPNNITINVHTRSNDSISDKTISLNLEKYLKGIDEIQDYIGKKNGGMNMLKAQAIVSRTYAFVRTNGFQNTIKATHADQLFTYKKIGKLPYLSQAVDETSGKIIVDSTTNQPFETEFKSKFCGPSLSYQPSSISGRSSNHTNPSYTSSRSYEDIAYQKLYDKSIDSTCN
ncbi:MAG: SpoIID/LytB domain-containing protein [Candidatus Shapirobacteria bacterium]